MTKQKVIMTIGLPGSGKSTWAKEWVAKDPTNRVRINKDDLRSMLHGGKYSKGNEKQILAVEEAVLKDSLERGKSVVIDNTHLGARDKHMRRINAVIDKAGFCTALSQKDNKNIKWLSFEVQEFHTSPEICIQRDLKRANSVGQDVIWRMYWDHVAVIEEAPKEDNGLPYCIIVDVDGTLAEMNGRSPYDWSKVSTDKVRPHIVNLIEQYDIYDQEIIVFTGRDGSCLQATKDWLFNNEINYSKIFIRPEGDCRPDYIVKRELYEQNIKGKYNVMLVVDDRPQVIREWRRLGLPVINANPCDREF